ncbi:nucleotidyltransferase family protein [Larkinella terrae]|uniref:Nucleotidyltransferase domain-containing protein n=1 Tax=Larkinella terrae TaxID=2025311 RepID=A0A7K0EL66_9BACT|nr:nucleotidyltransferase domain-containing protein [Larkinella terrae]MRS62593.1 nucleotidyltransferase domain-containing protein [Larkinella terrae]
MLTALIGNNLEAIKQIALRHHVRKLYVFGSACTNRFEPDSDIDLLLSFDQNRVNLEDYADNYFDLAEELEKLLGRPVELVEEATLQNPYFIRSVNQTKIPILE